MAKPKLVLPNAVVNVTLAMNVLTPALKVQPVIAAHPVILRKVSAQLNAVTRVMNVKKILKSAHLLVIVLHIVFYTPVLCNRERMIPVIMGAAQNVIIVKAGTHIRMQPNVVNPEEVQVVAPVLQLMTHP